MTKAVESEPWRALPASVADLIEPELEGMTEEILVTIGREVPEYARPLEGSFGRGVRTGVAEALRQFVALVRNPEAGREPGREVYLGLGRGELRQGRTLDSLQAAYRVGARVAWRRLSLAGRRAGLDPEVLSLLAEAIFAYIDELSADSVEGYAQAQSELDDQRRRRRRELAALLTRTPPAEEADVRAAAPAAGWRLPGRVAAAACSDADLGPLARRLPADVLTAPLDEVGCILIPDPDGPGRAETVERAAGKRRLVLGPSGALGELPGSWSMARSALRAAEAGALPETGLLIAEQRLGDLLVFEGSRLARRIAASRLAPLDRLTETARDRMLQTARAYIRHQGNSVAMAAALHVHPQTVRYRTARLRELLGGQLEDPDARFELEIALRYLAR
ncbi:MAG TPA: helix-turn-helix domain-containing protein [Solirubrobacterales bacterium]